MALLDRFFLLVLGVLCVALGAAAAGEGMLLRSAIDKAMVSAGREHAAIMRERLWRGSTSAVIGGARDTDAALREATGELAVCVGRLAVAESKLRR